VFGLNPEFSTATLPIAPGSQTGVIV